MNAFLLKGMNSWRYYREVGKDYFDKLAQSKKEALDVSGVQIISNPEKDEV